MAAAMKTPKRKTKSASEVHEPELTMAVLKPVESVEQPATLVLASHCALKDAARLKLELCAMAHQSAELSVDVAAVERIDTSTMQLLCAFVRDRVARNQQVRFKGDSQSWREAVRLLGVAELLGLKRADEGMQA
jgi:ABC-type transporter Mla MlaB component